MVSAPHLTRKTMSDSVDRVFYINLERRPERRAVVEAELAKVGLLENAERFQAVDTASFGILGCGLSHLGVLKTAKARGYRNVLIVEDDLVFLVEREELERSLRQLFDSKVDFGVCMLAYNLVESEPVDGYAYLKRVKKAHTAAAYLVAAPLFDPLIELYETAMPCLEATRQHWIYANDQIWTDLQREGNWYCFSTRLARQAPGWSDNAQAVIDHGC